MSNTLVSTPTTPVQEAQSSTEKTAAAVPQDSIIVARNVYKMYDTGKVQVQALRGVDLRVARGEMVAVMGPSGCGKTTLLNCLSGLDEIDSGEVLIEGAALDKMSDRERTAYRARRMGFIFQFYNLLPDLNSVENVELPLLLSGERSGVARSRAKEALALVGLENETQQLPGELSGGQRQRVTIARALVNNPAIVWADEPTGDLDSETAAAVTALMRRLNEEHHLTFVIVTHDIGVGRQTDRIIRMNDGRVVDDMLLA